ncbi:unnamed protein product [Rotaria magnacalcarata]|uniref:Uncharacterized protein n=1 Tax=Rotaria magnacalcarata TaxID=392030 RepID=A0A816QAD6_9BILA|nr:unnamed protein product [Rotaria magnacalcarata]CAF3915645.1 unnamed protein product [Rotaria magnacalcarata]
MNPIKIFGFTPLGVILAERLTYSLSKKFECYSDVHLIEQKSSLSIDVQWQSVSLLCLINLLKQCRMLQSNDSKKFGINIQSIKMNKQLLYSYVKLSTERVQKYYLILLKQRQIQFELSNYSIDNDERLKENLLNYVHNDSIQRLLNMHDFALAMKTPWQSYFRSSSPTDISSFDHDSNSIYITYVQSSNHEFNRSLRLNVFHTMFQYLPSYSSVKLIGPDVFAFELAYLLSTMGCNQIYFYRMNPNETSMLSMTETNSILVTLFEIFSKLTQKPLADIVSWTNQRPILHIIEKYHQFQMNLNADGQLEYDAFIQPSIPSYPTSHETKKHKRTYLETFKQQTQESLTKFSTSNVHISNDKTNIEIKEEPLDSFVPSSTFFILIDKITSSDLKTYQNPPPSFPNAIRTFNSTPGALIFNIYETLRRISNDETIPQLTDIFLSVDRELCVIKNQTTIKTDRFGADQILQSQQHDLKRPVENLHDLHKIIQRPANEIGQLILYESQLFQNDALDLQSLLLLFNPREEIPKNELIFLFHNDYNWHNLIVLPDHKTKIGN